MIERTVELHPRAIADARAARRWYASRWEAAETALVAELDAAISRISESPLRWPVYLHGTRRYLLKRFPFAIVFRVTDQTITVLAVAHARRRPGYWLNR